MLLDFGIKDIFDIILVSGLMYYIYKLMRVSGAINIFFGVMAFLVAWVLVSHVFEMRLLGGLLDKLVDFGIIALVILFQEEIRRFFIAMGSHKHLHFFAKFFFPREGEEKRENILPIVMACLNLSRDKVGALIVIEEEVDLSMYSSTGELINADISTRLIENIFFKNSPLHDGAMIISHNRIKSAGCILPVSHSQLIPKKLGLRHRAALGVSQETDAYAIAVSEETGNISIAYRGEIRIGVTAEQIENILTKGVW
ncbi:MAG: diadenylate cyclase CdaA [Bacteroidales bacterium]|jgi:diadenylate cyclase|nr:diadenylate cyclase CdaA [Bacteroidales bacterium]MDD3161927.1 diadenylate cyclase CdaA [Bacteroidales bacterium]